MNRDDVSDNQLEKDEKKYLTSLLKKEPTAEEMLEFRSALFALGKSIYKQYISQIEGRCNES